MSEENAVNPAAEALPEAQSESAEPVAQAAAEGTSDAQAVADAADPVKAAQAKVEKPAAEEDPEIEFGEGLKFKRSEAAKLIQKRKELDRAAFAKFEEAAKQRKEMERLLEADPEEFLRKRGLDPIQFAVERLQREVQMREATPEQRALMEAQARIQALESEKQAFTQQQENARLDGEKQAFIAKLDKELPEVVKKTGLPIDPLIFRQVAGVMGEQINSGVPVDPEMAAEIVADSYRDTFKQYTATLRYEDVVKQFPEFVKLVREGDLARAKSVQAAPARPAVRDVNAPKKPEPVNGAKKFNDYFNDWDILGVQR